MKILITESRRNKLAKQELDKEFSNLYEDVYYQTDSIGEQKIIYYRNGDETIMLYGNRANALYICEDTVKPIIFFGYTPQEVKQLVGEWFSDKFELPVRLVHHVNKSVLN
jgi:hypothetical protein